jgi:type III secretory pathway component EscR
MQLMDAKFQQRIQKYTTISELTFMKKKTKKKRIHQMKEQSKKKSLTLPFKPNIQISTKTKPNKKPKYKPNRKRKK